MASRWWPISRRFLHSEVMGARLMLWKCWSQLCLTWAMIVQAWIRLMMSWSSQIKTWWTTSLWASQPKMRMQRTTALVVLQLGKHLAWAIYQHIIMFHCGKAMIMRIFSIITLWNLKTIKKSHSLPSRLTRIMSIPANLVGGKIRIRQVSRSWITWNEKIRMIKTHLITIKDMHIHRKKDLRRRLTKLLPIPGEILPLLRSYQPSVLTSRLLAPNR